LRDFAEVGDDGGIEGVGLGQQVHGFGKVANLTGVDDDGRKVRRQQSAEGGHLIRAGGLEDDPLGGMGLDPGRQFGDAGGRVGKTSAQIEWTNEGIEVIAGDINADDNALHGKPSRRKKYSSNPEKTKADKAEDFPVPAGECGVRSGDYSN
jgi:hypothetical protein